MSGSRFNQRGVAQSATRFSRAPIADLEYSKMTATPTHLTTFNAGDIVPIYAAEVLPHDTFSIDLDFVIRQTTARAPTMGQMQVDFFAFWEPNRVINESWKNVQGENSSGEWVAPEVSLVPLLRSTYTQAVQVPVGSVADYYGFPTQQPIPAVILQQCNDLLFRGYLEIYNEHFRDQNYQAPIPFSKLNVYEGFMEPVGTAVSVSPSSPSQGTYNVQDYVSDGSSPDGAVVKAVYGEGINSPTTFTGQTLALPGRATSWSALNPPLKANKLHDYFTSVLPSPQKGSEYIFNLASSAPVEFSTQNSPYTLPSSLKFQFVDGVTPGQVVPLFYTGTQQNIVSGSEQASVPSSNFINGWNVTAVADLSQASAISVSDLRFGAAVQQVYETLARGGSRYREFINAFFGLDVENPFSDTSVLLGHVRRNLDLYQTAQTSASPTDGSGTPQGNLAAFGYTSNGGHLFTKTFVEHGYVHIFAVVRHRNIYPSFMSRDKFRLNTLDFYLPQLANISEQPVYTREINPFVSDPGSGFGFQEAWSEYRYEPDRVSSFMRPGISESLALWNYADDFDSGLEICDGDWLVSNSAEVLDRSITATSSTAPQFKGLFRFSVTKERPMPTYSVPGMDII